MATRIEWAEDVWNPILGCNRVSPGCDGCYAIRQSRMRSANPNAKVAAAHAGLVDRVDGRLDWTGRVNPLADRLDLPLRRKKPTRYFVNSGSDLFHAGVTDEFIARVFATMAQARQHTFLVLTKRPGRMRSLLNDKFWWQYTFAAACRDLGFNYATDTNVEWSSDVGILPNVWLGVSVEDQHWADIRIPILLDTPAAVRWISAEPLLGPIDLDQPRCDDHGRMEIVTDEHGREWCGHCSADGFTGELSFGHWLDPLNGGLGWVVAGGESGPGARAMSPRWARSLRDQCRRTGTAFYFKQWGEWGPAPFVVRVPLGDDGRWHGTEAELEAAKRDAEARGATHVHTHHTYTDETGRTEWDVHEIGHKPWSLERAELPEGPEPIRRWGKKAAGRKLDGVVWEQYPQAVTA